MTRPPDRLFIWTNDLADWITRDVRDGSRSQAGFIAWSSLVFGAAVTALLIFWGLR